MAKYKLCRKGYSCGKSCISISKMCRIDFPVGVAASLETRQAQLGVADQQRAKARVYQEALKKADKIRKGTDEKENRIYELKAKKVNAENYADATAAERLAEIVAKEGQPEDPLSLFNQFREEERVKAEKENAEADKEIAKLQKAIKEDDAKVEALRQQMVKGTFELERDMFPQLPETAAERKERIDNDIKERWVDPPLQQEKFNRFKELGGLNDQEAAGMSAWVSASDYFPLNAAIYNPWSIQNITPRELEYVKQANEYIKDAVKKMPKFDRDEVLGSEKGVKATENRAVLPPGQFKRGLNVDNPDQFIQKYLVAKGKRIEEETHTAATLLGDHKFIKEANIVFNVKAKDDGTGAGVSLDQYKNYAFEGEIFWAAGQKFDVGDVRKNDQGVWEVDVTEV
jgi:hypothetical protein